MPRIKDSFTGAVRIRIGEVVVLILNEPRFYQSKTNAELNELVKTKYNVKLRQAKTYICAAKKIIADMVEKRKEQALERALLDREFLLNQAKEVPDNKLALEIVKDRDKILGLYVDEVKQTGEMTMKNVDMSKFTEHGLERLKRGDTIEEVLMDPKAMKTE